ncbi:MAG: hypothetical protein J5I50_07820 [Chitinophagaceae bacterium]|nr:hypothetical protein [Chitinophagaceae bacterium]
MKHILFYVVIIFCLTAFSTGCNSQGTKAGSTNESSASSSSAKVSQKNFKEGEDYWVLNRARVTDRVGFPEPVEVMSFLLPRAWNYEGDVIWVMPGQAGQGNYLWFNAVSPDQKWQFTMFPNMTFVMSDQPFMNQAAQAENNQFKMLGEPVDAETYLRRFFVNELGNPEIIKVEQDEYPRGELQRFEEGKAELAAMGAANVDVSPSRILATVKWPDGTEGLVGCMSFILKVTSVNGYTGQYNTNFTTVISGRNVVKYPAAERDRALKLMSTIDRSVRFNTAWKSTVDQFWKAVRQQSRIDTWNKVRMMDEYTRQMGRNAINKGNQNLARMDANMRSWEARQQSQDQMHAQFIKGIREVETYQDATGTYEMSSHYNHAWSRSDGSSFIMTDNPNFDPSSVFQDQQWKEMKRVK